MKNIKNSIKDIIEFLNGFKNMINDLCTKGKRIKQIPNLLTLSRVGFALIIPPLAMSGGLIPAGILTIIAALTDGIDGFVARKLDAVSEFGKNLDPVCDKIFAGLLLLPLIGKVSPLLSLGLCANVALELGIAGVNLKSKAKGNIPRTTILGKIKTGMLSILIASLYVSFSYQAITSIIPIIYALATTTQVVTLIDYERIDKAKDIKKKEISEKSKSSEIEDNDNSNFSKSLNKSAVDIFISQKEKSEGSESKSLKIIDVTFGGAREQEITQTPYSSTDFRNLREEVIRTRTYPNETTKQNNAFQKTK